MPTWSKGIILGTKLPADITGNSLVLTPVSGDASPLQLALMNGSGSSVFLVDASGDAQLAGTLGVSGATTLGALTAGQTTLGSLGVTGNETVGGTFRATGATTLSTLSTSGQATLSSLAVTNAATVGSTLGVTGVTTAARFMTTGPGSSSGPILGYTGAFQGQGTSETTGLYCEGTYGQWYEMVGGYTARSISYSNGAPRDNGASAVTHNFYTGLGSASQIAHRFYVNGNSLAFAIYGNASATFFAALTASAGLTAAGLTLSSGKLTFADGSSLSTAPAAANVGSSATFGATSTGTAAAPAFAYSGANNGAGLYFDGAQGNVILSANGAKTLFTRAANGALSGASGVGVASTLGAGTQVFGVYGNAVDPTVATNAQMAVDGAGVITASGLTLASGGTLTFPDGTKQTTAGGGGTAGTQLRYGTGAPSSTNPAVQNDGDSYIDQQQSMLYGPRQNGTWPTPPVSLMGPTGPAGVSMLTSQSVGFGPAVMCTTAVSPTAVLGTYPGSSQANTFIPSSATSFMGLCYANYNATVANTITLYDQTAGAVIWSGTAASNGVQNLGQFAINQYPMPANHAYVWQVSAASSTTASLFLAPLYLFPAASAFYNVSSLPTAAMVNYTFTSSATAVNVCGSSTIAMTIRPPKAASVYAFTVTNTNASAVTLQLWNASGTAIISISAAANSSAIYYGPYINGQYALAAGTQYYWVVKGSGVGSIYIDTQILFSVA